MVSRSVRVFVWSRKVHRLSLFPTTLLFLFMSATGLVMKYPVIGKILHLDPLSMRSLHNRTSPFFAFFLGIMAITGLSMYGYPIVSRIASRRKDVRGDRSVAKR